MKAAVPRYRDAPSAALLVAALMVSCIRLIVTEWTSDLDAVAELTVLGALLGLLLGLTRFRSLAVWIMAAAYGLLLIPIVTAWTIYPDASWPERMASLAGRLGYSQVLFFSGQPVSDTILFLVFAGLVYWIVSLASGYGLTRTGSLARAVVPGGLVLIVIQLFDPQAGERAVYLALYCFLCLVLLGRMTLVRRGQFWKQNRVWLPPEARTSLSLTMIAAALGAVLLAWLLPVSPRPLGPARALWQSLTRPLDRAIDDLGNAVAGLEGPEGGAAATFFGESLDLALQAENSGSALFTVRLPGLDLPRYYWRVRTYDRYEGGEWESTAGRTLQFSPGDRPLAIPDASGLRAAEFAFDVSQRSLAQLVTPARPVWISRPVLISYLPAASGQLDSQEFGLAAPLLAGEEYRVHAVLASPTVEQMQAAGVDYPAWVLERYLQLPEDLPVRIADLAESVTAEAATPYEKAEAVTRYLRDAITYSENVPAPPPGEDKLAWFLFEHQAGFCTYYASAEVVMLRSLGIPARLAVGFAEGEAVTWNQRLVRERDTHAWPEVYFPGLGWVEFEPTGSQPALARPARTGEAIARPEATAAGEPSDAATPTVGPAPVSGPGSGSGGPPNTLARLTLIFLALIAVLAVGLLAYIFGWLDRALAAGRRAIRTPLPILLKNGFESLALTPPAWLRRWAYSAGLGPIQRSFAAVYQGLRWMGESFPPSLTPAEAAARLGILLAEAAPDLQVLLAEYHPALYGRKAGDLATVRAASARIRRQALRAALRRRLDLFRHALARPFRRSRKGPEPL